MNNPFRKEENCGLVPDSFDPRDVWADEILGADEIEVPKKYTVEGLKYEKQGARPFCVSFACTTLLENFYSRAGEKHEFSQPHLFFHSGGSKTGSSFRVNLETLRDKKKGAVPYSTLPMPSGSRPADWYEVERAIALGLPFLAAMRLGNYVRVQNDPIALRKAVMAYGPLMVGVQARGNYYSGRGTRTPGIADNHAVLLTGWDDNKGVWEIFDSLSWVEKTRGYGTLDSSYEFIVAYAATELPKNWKKKVEKVRSKGFDHVLNHYGRPRNLEAEQRAAVQMMDEFKRFNNQSVFDAAGRFWTVLINAVVYGGYSISYKKFGIWQPGDIINDIYHWRRTGEHIFDFNEERVR